MKNQQQNLLLLHERNPIHLTLTEEDRQKAQSYVSNTHCLIATALKRVGLKNLIVGAAFVDTEIGCFEIDRLIVSDYSNHNRHKPWYKPEIVGQSITLLPYPPVATLQ